jgi:hypothetical protein
MMGRQPTPDDLIVPMPRGPKTPLGKMRSKNDSYKRLYADLETLGLRHRRGHDLRRTMISLARTDGARKDLLELCTHNPGKGQSTIDVYTSFSWEALCGEVAKLKVKRHALVQVIALPLVAAARGNEGGSLGPFTRAGSPCPHALAGRRRAYRRWQRRYGRTGRRAAGCAPAATSCYRACYIVPKRCGRSTGYRVEAPGIEPVCV